jgi:hypothetical protein
MLLDFANSGRVDPRVTCTRATTAMRTNKRGLLEIVPANVPRIDYNPFTGECLGLFVEGGGTNLFLQSSNFLNASWTKGDLGVTTPSAWIPTGPGAAGQLTPNTNNAGHHVRQSATVTAGGVYTVSIYAKDLGYPTLQIFWTAAHVTGSPRANFDLAAGVLGSVSAGVTATMTPIGNGWYRCTATVTAAGTALECFFSPQSSAAAARNPLYSGDGTSAVLVWGAQLESSAFAFSYTPTTTAAVTRSSDLVQMLGNNFSDWYRPEGGTFVVQGSRMTTAGALIALGSSSTGTRMALYGNGPAVQIVIDGTTQVQSTISGGVTPAGTTDISAVAMALDDFAFVKNGGTVGTDTAGLIQSPTAPFNRLHIGSAAWANPAADYLGGYIRRIAYYPSRLSNAQIQMLTAP